MGHKYQLKPGASKDGPHPTLSLASYTCITFILSTILCSEYTCIYVLFLQVGGSLLQDRMASVTSQGKVAPVILQALVSTSPLSHQCHPGPHTMSLTGAQSALYTR